MGEVIFIDGESNTVVNGWAGQVEFRADLPIALGDPILQTVYLVEKPTTILLGLYTTYQSGLYIRNANTGALSDWERLNVKLKFTDGEFAIVNAADESKQVKFDASLLTTATTRTFQLPDLSGVLALSNDNELNIYSALDMPLTLAADGVMRFQIPAKTTLIMHNDFPWPKLAMPEQVGLALEFVKITSKNDSLGMLIDGDGTPHIWGRNSCSLIVNGFSYYDISNSGAGHGSLLYDIVGAGQGVIFYNNFVASLSFLDLGTIQDMSCLFAPFSTINALKGVVLHSTKGLTHQCSLGQAVSFGVPNITPAFTFSGNHPTLGFSSSVDSLLGTDSMIGIDSAGSGINSITGVSFNSAVNGTFFKQPISKTITAMANADVSITSFVDSPTSPGVNVQANIASYSNVKVGQTILIDSGPYVGNQVVLTVSSNQLSFEFVSVFSTGSSALMQRTRFTTSANHQLCNWETNTISGTTSYNGTKEVLEVEGSSNTTFLLAIEFISDEGTGTMISTPRTGFDSGVNISACGDEPDSQRIGTVIVVGNTATTVISTIDTWTDLNLNSSAVLGSDTEKFDSLNTSTGEVTYNDTRPIKPSGVASISAVSSGGSQQFKFRFVVNGLVTSDGVEASSEIGGDAVAIPLQSPLSLVDGDDVRIQVKNVDGTSNITIQNLSSTIR